MPVEGKKAPDFTLKDQDGKSVSLSDYKGKNVVLYFYPQDDTETCTKQACGFRDEFQLFKKLKAEIIGVSPDSVESHIKFKKKYNLPFTLLSDEDKKVIKKYDVWKQKIMFGNKYMGVERTTIVIDKDGKIKKIFRKVRLANHIEQLSDALKS